MLQETRFIHRSVPNQEVAVFAVYPFPIDGVRFMFSKGHYDDGNRDDLPVWMRQLADKLWDSIPGIQQIIFSNGEIQLTNSGVCTQAEVIEMAKAIILPFLEVEFRLMSIASLKEGST